MWRLRPYAPQTAMHHSRSNSFPVRTGWCWCVVLASILLLACAKTPAAAQRAGEQHVDTDPLNREPAVQQAFARFYNLDYDGALAAFQKIRAAHPEDPIAADYLLDATLFRNLYALDLLDTTLYAHDGFLSSKHAVAEDKEVTTQIEALADKAIALSDRRLQSSPRDADALFARAWARSLRALYVGLVEHSYIAALRQALQARQDDDAVLKLDPAYVDAELVVGVHQYVVGSLPRGVRMLAGMAGMHGDKQHGIALLQDDGNRGVITSVEARTALMLFLRREGKYGDATAVAQSLAAQYPHDFLFVLEEANLQKDAGNAEQAMADYKTLLASAKRNGYFPNAHLELAWFGYGETLRGQKDHAGAAHAFEQALGQPSISTELKRRAELNLGEEYDVLGLRDRAVSTYQQLRSESPDTPQAEEAGHYLKAPFQG